MKINNKSLLILAVGVFVLSVMGTMFSVELLKDTSTVAYATSDIGVVNLTIEEVLSITLTDNIVNFGSCTLNDSRLIVLDSSLVEGDVDNTYCDATDLFPDSLTLRNSGNIHANVVVQTDNNASTLFGTSGVSGFGYKVANNVASPGCTLNLQTDYLNFTTIGGTDYPVCENLTAISNNDSIDIYIGAWLASTATGGGIATLTFEASNANI